jgi:hypothetical protein
MFNAARMSDDGAGPVARETVTRSQDMEER